MQKIISAKQTRLVDQHSINTEPISSIQLMERASEAFVREFVNRVKAGVSIHVIAGMGNNGGDGLAIARLLKRMGFIVEVTVLEIADKMSPDCDANFKRLNKDVQTVALEEFNLGKADIVIDAILGSGLSRPINDALAKVVEVINESDAEVFSVDIPSGLFSDIINAEGAVVKADFTITFQRPKLTFLIPETGQFVGDWSAVDIGLDEEFIESQNSSYHLIDNSVRAFLPQRKKFQHKGDFGSVQVFAGSLGKIGATFLCSKAVMRAGAGLLTIHTPSCGVDILQSSLPEAMLTVDYSSDHISSGEILHKTKVVCIGPGVGQHKETIRNFKGLLESKPAKLVVDADGLNILAKEEQLMDLLPKGTILTPHVGEFHRLFGTHSDGLSRINTARQIATQRMIIIVLKGAHTAVICSDGNVYFNNTGNAGMATAGSGDVLAGIITGLLAQGMSSEKAAVLGVYLHGRAGDKAAKKVGKVSLLASDLLEFLPEAISNE